MRAVRREVRLEGQELGFAELPCGTTVDLSKGECCKHSCPDPAIRNADTRGAENPIEQCYRRLRAQRPAG